MQKKLLSELLGEMIIISTKDDKFITGISISSQKIQAGFLFIAYPGLQDDGRNYIGDAIERGAEAILVENDGFIYKEEYSELPIIRIENLEHKVSSIAAKFYDNPSASMNIIGITGTNGKTSIAFCLSAIFNMLNKPCAYIGTLGTGVIDDLEYGLNTTPDPILIQHKLAEFKEAKINNVVMEVSSHALSQGRVNHVEFDSAIFTNLSQDHLDYHKNMEEYFQAKEKLFSFTSLKNVLINIDDPYANLLMNKINSKVRILSYSLTKSRADFFIEKVESNNLGINAVVNLLGNIQNLSSKLIGEFNLYNLLAVMGICCIEELNANDYLKAIHDLDGIPGRMEVIRIDSENHPMIIVDFAHTPDALEHVLKALKSINANTLWCVFGCGGNRDKTKRSQMGKIAYDYSDAIIITNDNPRFESPETISLDILHGIEDHSQVFTILDRKDAINYALEHAQTEDVVLIAGKGHEKFQEIAGDKFAFSDQEICREFYLSRNK